VETLALVHLTLVEQLGRETIDHPARGHDDHANAAAIALVLAEGDGQTVAFGALAVASFT
jgi:hypothetical protein